MTYSNQYFTQITGCQALDEIFSSVVSANELEKLVSNNRCSFLINHSSFHALNNIQIIRDFINNLSEYVE